MTSADHRAEQLAQLAHFGQLTLPAPVTTAISGYEAVMASPAPPMPERGAEQRAIAALADELARQAMLGKQPASPPQPLDVTAITAARQADQDALDRVALARELREAAAAVLCQVFAGSNGQQVIGAIQARHAELMAELVRHAHLLPPGADDQAALEHGGEIRESYLAARDLAATITQLREAVRLVEDRTPFDMPDDLEITLAYERTGRLYREAWMAPISATTYGPLGSFQFWLGAAREPDWEFWLPSAAELQARAAQVREKMHTARVRGLDPAHVF